MIFRAMISPGSCRARMRPLLGACAALVFATGATWAADGEIRLSATAREKVLLRLFEEPLGSVHLPIQGRCEPPAGSMQLRQYVVQTLLQLEKSGQIRVACGNVEDRVLCRVGIGQADKPAENVWMRFFEYAVQKDATVDPGSISCYTIP